MQLMDADLDATKQVSQIETAISENAEAILVEPCSVDGLTTGLKEAHDAGIPVFVIHNNVSATRLGHISDSCRCKTRRGIENGTGY